MKKSWAISRRLCKSAHGSGRGEELGTSEEAEGLSRAVRQAHRAADEAREQSIQELGRLQRRFSIVSLQDKLPRRQCIRLEASLARPCTESVATPHHSSRRMCGAECKPVPLPARQRQLVQARPRSS